MKTISAQELNSRIGAKGELLLHVLPEEIFSARRIAGSKNACVYETAFLSKVDELVPDKERAIIIYGAGAASLDATLAAEKLQTAEYHNVIVFPGGIEEWDAAGFPMESDGALPSAPDLSGTFRVDTAESVIRWTGRNLFNHHNGTVKLASGEIVLRENTLVSAHFTIAMDTIACEDLTDATWNAMLIRHLHDADFFDVAHHPVAEFHARAADLISTCTDGTPNYLLRGEFTLRGITRHIEIPIVAASADGARITAQGQFELDRTEFGSIYGSGKFFRFLGKHIVNDHIHLHVKLHADKMN